MDALAVSAVVLGAAWTVAAFVVLVCAERRSLAGWCALPAAGHVAAAAWAPLTPFALSGWVCFALVAPAGAFGSRSRRALGAVAVIGAAGWVVALAISHTPGASTASLLGVTAIVAFVGAAATALRWRGATAEVRRGLQWLAAATVIAIGASSLIVTLWLIVDRPHDPIPYLIASLVLVPIGVATAAGTRGTREAGIALRESIAAAGVALLVAIIYLVIVAGINGVPKGHERSVLLASLASAIAVALFALPVRNRLRAVADAVASTRLGSAEEVASTFQARMSRAVPMDELMLQLAESLRATIAGAGAEVWTGTDGNLSRAVSVPDRGSARLRLGEREARVVGQARLGGPAWTAMWLPSLLDTATPDVRVVPIAHLGELLGIIVVRRAPDAAPITGADEAALVDLARQLGLALHNVRLDSALQASLAELAERNVELQASRLRIVAAADASRREIERNLHDGAQQHLVALAVKLGLAQQILDDGEIDTVQSLLGDLRDDVQGTIKELRELAHGIYPPLLRDRGLGEALRAAAVRSSLPCAVDVDLPGRFPEDVETAAYFCCLEAMQNAGKYAGEGASLQVSVGFVDARLCVELHDDGAGFDVMAVESGHGFVNMRDRLGAIDGELSVQSAPGSGTTVAARIPTQPLGAPTPSDAPV